MRDRNFSISLLLGKEEINLEERFGFYLLESEPNFIGGERREYEVETYPERNGVKVHPYAGKNATSYTITFCAFGAEDTVTPRIKEFEELLYLGGRAREFTVYNDAKGIQFRGYNQNIVPSDFHVPNAQDIVVYDWIVYVSSGEIGVTSHPCPVYELVSVELTSTPVSSCVGQIVTIGDEKFKYNGSPVQKRILIGDQYTISVDDKHGFLTPKPLSYTAVKAERAVTMTYSEDTAVSEKVTVSLVSNIAKYSKELQGTSFFVHYGNETREYEWMGSPVDVLIPNGETYEVSFGGNKFFATPKPQTYIAVEGGVRPVVGTYATTVISVVASSNQKLDADIQGTNVSIISPYYEERIYKGEPLQWLVPTGSFYRVQGGEIDGYKRADVATGKASLTLQNVDLKYYTCLLNISLEAHQVASLDGRIVTVNGHDYNYTAPSIVVKVPSLSSCDVSVNALQGYARPKTKSFTAGLTSLDVHLEYTLEGVYVLAQVQGKPMLYKKESWSSQGSAVGVAIITDKDQFAIGTSNLGSKQWMEDSRFLDPISGATIVSTRVEAIEDMRGYANTKRIVEATKGSTSASWICYDGRGGFLGSAGQWSLAYVYKKEVNDLLKMLVSDPITEYPAKYWTSTQKRDGDAWAFGWGINPIVDDVMKIARLEVRKFILIPEDVTLVK